MLPASSLSAKDRLRRPKSTRSIRRNRQSPSDPFDPELARTQAMAAASNAMRRSNERSSMDSKRSYDCLGGLENMAVPSRLRPADSGISEPAAADGSSPHLSTMCYIENQDTYPVALPSINEFGGLDGRMSSQPSSYRRLRKARSMFSTRQRAPQMSHGISSESYGRPVASQNKLTDASRPHSTLRRSMSFLRGGDQGNQPSKSIRHAASQDAAIQLARKQFLEAHKPSLVTIKPRREHKPFRKTFRTISGSVMDAPNTPLSEQSKRSAGIHVKARAFSSTIKKGLKRVLGLSNPPEESVPGQEPAQWDSPRYSIDSGVSQGSDYSYYNSPSPEYHASPARPPTMRSARSSESLAASRSRVTSWADSTVANTVTARKAGERDPLSIIDENGTPGGQSRQCSPRPHASVDGQRLYSALMKHIGGENINDPDDEVALGHVKEHRSIPERTSSLHTCRSRRTIRQIPSDDSMASPLSFATANAGMSSPQRQRSRQSRRHQYHQPPRYSQDREIDRFEDISSLRKQPLDSLFEIGEYSDDESGSIIVDRSKDPDKTNSPSVYSRTTNGDSPKNGRAVGQSHEANEAPGMAMIYESQRTVYNSPKRTAGSSSAATPIQPSGDWQKWVNSQMERIELTPTREHYREEAQVHDDDQNDIDTLALSMQNDKPFGPSETESSNKVRSQSSFSRPFSRSSSVRSIPPYQKNYTPDNKGVDRGPSLSVRTGNRLPPPESPTPKRDVTDAQPAMMATGQFRRRPISRMPISREAKAVQFRSMRGRENRRPTDENVKADHGRGDMEPHKYQDGYSPISSKQMVDRFLDSRCQQMDGDVPRGAFI